MHVVNVHEAELFQLLEETVAGGEVVIARRGKPVVRLVVVEEAGPRPDEGAHPRRAGLRRAPRRLRGLPGAASAAPPRHARLPLVRVGRRAAAARARSALLDQRNDRWLSVDSIREMALELGPGKLRLDVPLHDLIEPEAVGNGIAILPLEALHAMAVEALPFHHRGPFDRVVVCQALAEGLTLVSGDAAFAAYPVPVLWSERAGDPAPGRAARRRRAARAGRPGGARS